MIDCRCIIENHNIFTNFKLQFGDTFNKYNSVLDKKILFKCKAPSIKIVK